MNWISLIVAALSQLPNIIVAIETIIGAGNGTQKKSIAVSTVTAPATLAGATPEQIQSLTSAAGTIIDATVTSLNAAGVFKQPPTIS